MSITVITQDCTADMIAQEVESVLPNYPELQGFLGGVERRSIIDFINAHPEIMRGALQRVLDKTNQSITPKTKE